MGKINENIRNGEECCKLANERFGLSMGMNKLLSRFRCCDNTKNELIKLAKDRNYTEFEALLSKIGTVDSNEPCYTTIVKDVTNE